MTRISKGLLDAGWALAALTLAACATTPEPVEAPPAEPQMEAPAPEPSAEATPAPATVPSTEPEAMTPVAEPPVLQPDYPRQYTVTRGDTLWGLAQRYLRDPWRWPELWQKNPQVANPHLIYPGDVLTLIYVDGQPTLQVQRADEPRTVVVEPSKPPAGVPTDKAYPTVKLVPQVREIPLDKAIPVIPLDAINQFLSRPRIVSEDELDQAPYIVSSLDEHLTTGAGHRIYVRGLDEPQTTDFVVVRKGQVYVNQDDEDDILGYEAIHLGDAVLARTGDPATLDLVRTNREVLVGDRLLPADDGFTEQNFMPHSPQRFVDGNIIAVQGGVMQIGQYQVVVIDRGLQAGLDVGAVLAVYQASARVRDTIAGETIRLPRERAGTVLVFRVFERLSYALVMDATRPIHVNDAVTNP